MYSIIVDETTDVSNEEQVSLCLRYVAGGGTVETFVGFCKQNLLMVSNYSIVVILK